jgi:hypothetical protein
MLEIVKSIAKRLPFVLAAHEAYSSYRRSRMSTQEIFTRIFQRNAWKGAHSVSGWGSDPDQTGNIIKELPVLLKELGTSTMLDLPCGDFHWMRVLDLKDIKYIGADVVNELVCHNRRHESDNTSFVHLDLLADELPSVDLVFCRDCLVHFSFADVGRALSNICRSSSTYLLTTTFPDAPKNIDIVTGGWRVLNLQIEPFNLPPPLRVIVEGCTEAGGRYSDKSLGLWRVEDINECVKNCSTG